MKYANQLRDREGALRSRLTSLPAEYRLSRGRLHVGAISKSVLTPEARRPTEVDNDERQTAEEAVQRIESPLDVFLKHGRHLTHKPIESPIRCGRQRDSLHSNLQRHNFGWTAKSLSVTNKTAVYSNLTRARGWVL